MNYSLPGRDCISSLRSTVKSATQGEAKSGALGLVFKVFVF